MCNTCSVSFLFWQLKRWERKECKPNSLPVLHKLHVKVGDTVKVISGHEKGQIGEVTKIFKHNSTIIVKDINLKTKHVKSREEGEPGQINKVIIISLTRKNIIMNSSLLELDSLLLYNVLLRLREHEFESWLEQILVKFYLPSGQSLDYHVSFL